MREILEESCTAMVFPESVRTSSVRLEDLPTTRPEIVRDRDLSREELSA